MSIRRKLGLLVPAAAWMALIYVLSAQSTMPALEIGWLDRGVKSASHFGEYAILALLIARPLLGSRSRLGSREAVLVAALCFLYALSDEYHQLFVPGRMADWVDVAADSTGAVITVTLLTRESPVRVLRRLDPFL